MNYDKEDDKALCPSCYALCTYLGVTGVRYGCLALQNTFAAKRTVCDAYLSKEGVEIGQ